SNQLNYRPAPSLSETHPFKVDLLVQFAYIRVLRGAAMSSETVRDITNREYKAGFVTDIESESVPPGLDEDVIRLISGKKNEPEFLLAWRLSAFRHWQTMKEPT